MAVDPSSGPIGTLFTLTAGGLREGEAVMFEITFPGEGKAFPGAVLAVPADGTATTTYRATSTNPRGEYLVRLTGPPGRLAEGRFTITGGSVMRPSTTGSSGTASRPDRTVTTVKARSTTSTSIKSSSTTATSRKLTTSSSPTTNAPPTTA